MIFQRFCGMVRGSRIRGAKGVPRMSATAHEHGRVGLRAASASPVGPGDYRCQECGYGVSVMRALPRCPMCGGVEWEPAPRVRVRTMQIESELERAAGSVTATVVSAHHPSPR